MNICEMYYIKTPFFILQFYNSIGIIMVILKKKPSLEPKKHMRYQREKRKRKIGLWVILFRLYLVVH
jgi:hypothetical protein